MTAGDLMKALMCVPPETKVFVGAPYDCVLAYEAVFCINFEPEADGSMSEDAQFCIHKRS